MLDADCGVVLDRRSWPTFGPDGDNEGPLSIVESAREFLRAGLTEKYPAAKFRLSKRAIVVRFHAPLSNGEDPSADLIVALTRREEPGLWIPNREQDRWDASHPECHTELLTGGPDALRRNRARIVRLAKGWNKQFAEPGLSSFNVEALALASVTEGMGVARGLRTFFEFSAVDLRDHRTQDPAGVSGPIKLLASRDVIVKRLDRGAELIAAALDNDADESIVREALGELFHKYLEPPPAGKAAIANALRRGNEGVTLAGGVLVAQESGGKVPLKTTRSWGT